jgi:phospholipid transport system substrate-binding protein
MKKSLIIVTGIMLTVSASLSAAPYYGHAPSNMPMQQQTQVDPGSQLREGMTKLLKFMRQPEKPNQQMIAMFLEKEIAPYFDFDYMASWAAGPMGRQMNGRQKAEMAQNIKQLLLGTLTEKLTDYQNQDVRFYPPRRAGENEVKVRVGILQANAYPANIDFRFYRGSKGWKIFDVTANGNSALAFYRQYFNRQMAVQQMPRGYQR